MRWSTSIRSAVTGRDATTRECFEAILFRLVTGCSWDVAGRLGKGSETTLRRRRDEWSAAGVFDGLVDEALDGYDRIIGLDLSDVAVDGSQHKAPFGGEGTGPNPVDRGKCGWKWSIATDRNGIPIGWEIDRRQPQRLRAARHRRSTPSTPAGCSPTSTRCTSTAATTTASSPRSCAELGIDDLVCAKQRNRGHRQGRQANVSARDALARRTHELVAVELRATPPQHRPLHPPPPRPARPRRRRSSSPSSSSSGPTAGAQPPDLLARALSSSCGLRARGT